jgi:hypothetical protein
MNHDEWRDLMAGLAMVGLLASGERGKSLGVDSYAYADQLIQAKFEDSAGIISVKKRKKSVPEQETA